MFEQFVLTRWRYHVAEQLPFDLQETFESALEILQSNAGAVKECSMSAELIEYFPWLLCIQGARDYEAGDFKASNRYGATDTCQTEHQAN